MKRIKYIVFVFLISIIGMGAVSAASLSMSVSSKNVTVGNNVKVTVKATGAAGWEYCINYDSNVFKLTNGNKCVLGGTLAGNASVTYTFKALKQGSGSFTLGTVSMLDDDANELKVSKGSATVTVTAQKDISNPKTDSPKSENCFLRELKPTNSKYVMTPKFNKNTFSYEIKVENEVEEIGFDAFVEDVGKAVVHFDGDIDHIKLNEGANKITITVHNNESGANKNYYINVIREETAPLTVTVDGKEYTVLRSLEGVEKPKYFVEGTHEIEGEEVPALTNEVTGYTLVALKDVEGNVTLFEHSGKDFIKYVEINDEVLTLVPKDVVNLVKGYEQRKEIDINGNKIKVYYKDANSDFVLLYAMNVSNGETMWYTYDIKEGTLQRYVEEAPVEEGKNIYLYLAIGFAILAGIALLIIFLMMGLNSRLKKKNEKLVKKLKEQKVKVIEHPVFDTEMSVESWKHMSDDDSLYDDEAFFAREETPESEINSTVEIKSDSFVDEEPPKKKRKSSRKEAKAKKEAEEAELKAMREDFLKTRELEITKEMQAVDEPKKGKKKTIRKKKK